MRGLTDQERRDMNPDPQHLADDDTFDALLARGLLREACWHCPECWAPSEACQCGCELEMLNYEPTAAGLLALRLDAAARALTGVER